jgi:hypothetical protein
MSPALQWGLSWARVIDLEKDMAGVKRGLQSDKGSCCRSRLTRSLPSAILFNHSASRMDNRIRRHEICIINLPRW